MTIVWSPLAIDRVEEEAAFIAKDKPEAASRWLEALLKTVDRLELFPHSGHPVPELQTANHRQILYKSHRIIYRVDSGAVIILTVRRSRQLLDLTEVSRETAD